LRQSGAKLTERASLILASKVSATSEGVLCGSTIGGRGPLGVI
jgi:hypothetical protein